MADILKDYRSEKTKSQYLAWITELSENSALLFPNYLKNQLPEMPALTKTEMKVLRLLQNCYTNAQICEELGIALDTAKKHCQSICRKMQVKNRHQAVQRAVDFGIIEL